MTGSRETEVNYRVFQVIAPAHLAEVGFERRTHKFQITKCNKPSYPKEQYMQLLAKVHQFVNMDERL